MGTELTREERITIWKTCVEAVNRIETRRDNLIYWFGSILTVLALASSYCATKTSNISLIVSISILGIILCFIWWILLRRFLLLSEKKFIIIEKLEEAWEIMPMLDEWKLVKASQPSFGITKIQKILPFVFMTFFIFWIILIVCGVLGLEVAK